MLTMPCAGYFSRLGILVRIIGTIHGIDINEGELRHPFGSFRLNYKEPAFGIPAYGSNCIHVALTKVGANNATDAVDFSTKASRVELVTW